MLPSIDCGWHVTSKCSMIYVLICDPGCVAAAQKASEEYSLEDMAAWKTAWQLVSHHAWRLLDQGRLRLAVKLAQAILSLGVPLTILLQSTPEAARDGPPSAATCIAGPFLPLSWET